ncbi:alpha-mannosidase [Domibacillus enclensis]|uniref:Alpha-mannosidase n=1 Tax=Domibacillus enclensis TaxID=1017273 RepID=A0A1N6RRC2_9BACI|nr:alpha-mannosidase [Domibacillus enclensis]OXS79123.1 alpha-mannosidase [Domibacillus enclensis]SIQ31337.1 alpha-mannosidase [Domibacillus enclensis]
MFWTVEKLEARVKELGEYRYRERIKIPSFHFLLDEEGEIGTRPPENASWDSIKTGEYWSGWDVYAWLKAAVDVPSEWAGKEIVGLFDFGRTGEGNNSGFESLLYLNGAPFQGVDSNHTEVFFPDGTAGSPLEVTFRLWSGLEGGGRPVIQEHKIKQAELAWMDHTVDDLFFTGKAIVETVKGMDENRPEYHLLLKLLDRSFQLIDWSKPGTDTFYSSVYEAQRVLRDGLNEMEKHHPVTVRCIGHTHIDVAWLWRLKHTREKAARSFSTVLRLMEKYPDYVFLQTQPQLYEYIKTDYPEIYEQIKKRVEEGRWEAEGGMWLEADCNVTSGESLVRQLLMGTAFLRDEFGTECKYLWLPDVFGYSWALPQILKKSGIETFMTTKISWNQYNRMPHDTFKWKGIDGTEILTHFITTPEPNQDWWFYTYNGQIRPDTVQGIWDGYRDKSFNQELLLSYGYGDGGGGVNREMLEMRRRLDDIPGLPKVKTGRADEFFEELHKRVDETDQYVHTWDGELYLEYHRGTYTSQAYNKKMNRTLELKYRETEWLNVMASVLKTNWSTYPQQAIRDGWKIILRNQFHDIIPGSSIREVYEDSKLEYEQSEQLMIDSWANGAGVLVHNEKPVYTVLNSSPWSRTDVIEIDEKQAGVWKGPDGNVLKAVQKDGKWLVEAKNIPAMGYSEIQFSAEESAKEEQAVFDFKSNELHTPFYQLKWNDAGQLVSIYDSQAEKEVLAEGEKGNVLQVFEDKPLRFDAWDIDLYYQQKMKEITDLESVELIESNAIRSVVRFKWTFLDSSLQQDLIVYSHSRRIDFETKVDWHEQNQLLKAAFPVDIRTTEATYDIQYGNVKRPNHWNTSWDYARFESVGHQWADLSERGYGVSLLNNCKYGYDIKGNVMRLSLLKSSVYPDYAQDQGEHLFTYSLLPHEGDWVKGETVQEAWKLNNPMSAIAGSSDQASFSLFSCTAEHVMIDAVKKAEDGDKVILRVHEFSGSSQKATINSDLSITAWQECNLLEKPVADRVEGNPLSFELQPYEIKTFILDMTQG